MGGTRAPEARDARGSGGTLPQNILKSRGLEMLFPAFSQELFVIYAYRQNYLLRTLSQQNNAH